jgi:hypothetical protein
MDEKHYDSDFKEYFDAVVPLPSASLRQPKKILEVLSKTLGQVPRHLICCSDRLGDAYTWILRHHYHEVDRAKAFERCYLKSELRSRLFETGVDSMEFFVARNTAALKRWAMNSKVGYKVALKPVYGTASDLVAGPLAVSDPLVSRYKEVSALRRRDKRPVFFADRNEDWSRIFLVERWISGDEFTVEGVVDDQGDIDIVGVCQKEFAFKADRGVVCEGANYSPPSAAPSTVKALRTLTEQVVRCAGLRRAAFHAELRWDGKWNRPHLIELNPRLPGGLTARMHLDLVHVDLASYLLDVLEGRPVSPEGRRRNSGVRGDVPLVVTKKGVYKGCPNATELDPRVIHFKEMIPSQTAVDPSRKETYFAFAYLSASRHSQFFKLATRVRKRIRPVIE